MALDERYGGLPFVASRADLDAELNAVYEHCRILLAARDAEKAGEG